MYNSCSPSKACHWILKEVMVLREHDFSWVFSDTHSPTPLGKQLLYPFLMDQYILDRDRGMSNLDVAKINKLYNCSKCLKATPLSSTQIWARYRDSSFSSDCETIPVNSWYPPGLLWEEMQRWSWRHIMISEKMETASKLEQTCY